MNENSSNNTIDFPEIEWSQLNEFARQKKVVFGAKSVRVLELDPGFHELDWCVRGHVGYVVEGELKIQFKDRTEQFSSGQGMFIEFGDEHKAIETKQKVTLFLVDEA